MTIKLTLRVTMFFENQPDLFSRGSELELQHIGSTAVAGMRSKVSETS